MIRPGLAAAAAQTAAFDDAMQRRPDVLSTLGVTLAAMNARFADSARHASSWWFSLPAELAAASDAMTIHDLLRPEPVWPQESRDSSASGAERASSLEDLSDVFTVPLAMRRPQAEEVPMMPSDRPVFALAAASFRSGQGAIYVRSPEQPDLQGLLVPLGHGSYQFNALDAHRERTSRWDGAEVIALADSAVLGRAHIQDGVATFTTMGDMQSCVLRTADGHDLQLVPVP